MKCYKQQCPSDSDIEQQATLRGTVIYVPSLSAPSSVQSDTSAFLNIVFLFKYVFKCEQDFSYFSIWIIRHPDWLWLTYRGFTLFVFITNKPSPFFPFYPLLFLVYLCQHFLYWCFIFYITPYLVSPLCSWTSNWLFIWHDEKGILLCVHITNP